jgi:hypothetical protein
MSSRFSPSRSVVLCLRGDAPASDEGAGPPPWPISCPGAADVQVKIASQRSEWEGAFRLAAQAYQARGLQAGNSSELRFAPHHALPGSATFVARKNGQVIGTLSLVLDNTLVGLPLEELYGDAVAALRAVGRRLAEVTCLAGEACGPRSFPVTFALMRLMAHYFLGQGGDTMLISVHPRHRPFYERLMGFVPFGARKACPRVQNNPAEALLLDAALRRKELSRRDQLLLGERPPAQALLAPRLPAELARLFAGRSSAAGAIEEVLARIEQGEGRGRWLEGGKGA